MTTSPEEASVQEVVLLPEAGEIPIAVQMRLAAKAEIVSRLHEVKSQVLAITPARAFYAKNPPRHGEAGALIAQPSVTDIAADVQKAIEAVERL